MRFLIAALGLLALAPSGPAQDLDVVFQHVEVVARLGNDGALDVTETLQVETNGSVATLGQDFGLGVEQKVTVKGLTRIGSDGQEQALAAGDVKTADHYAAYPTWVQWSLKDEGAPNTPTATVKYRIEYALENALAPAWDLPNGPAVLDGLSGSYGSPLARVRDAWPLWREALPHLERHYRLDHDVIFPSRGNPTQSLTRLDYRLEWDVKTWRLVEPDRAMGQAHGDVDYRVRRTLERLAPDAPAAVDVTSPARRLAAILILPVGVIVLGIVSMLLSALRGAEQKKAGPAAFKEVVLSEPPEIVRARVQGGLRTPLFDAVLARLAAERRLTITSEAATSDDEVARTRLRLNVDRATLHAFDREIVDGVFGTSGEITAEEFRKRHSEAGLDPQDLVDAAFARAKPPAPRGSRASLSLATILFVAGIGLSVADLTRPGAEPYAPAAAALGGVISRIPLPPAALWLSLLGTLLQLVPNRPLVGLASFGVSIAVVSGYAFRFASRPSLGDPNGRRQSQLLGLRNWAQGELQKPRPALLDAWIPHLDALGLRPALEKWRRKQTSVTGGAPDLADMPSGEALAGPPFTGVASPAVTDADGWADGFYPND